MDADTLKQLIDEVEAGKPDLPDNLLNFAGGLSAPKVRRLLNALCSQPGAVYLEIGVYTGSTFIPAVYGNEAKATCIDNWKMFEGSREQFLKNVKQYIPDRTVTAIEDDCFAVDLMSIPRGVNIYFYDGDHTRAAQYQALTYYASALADRFVLIVDDCNWAEPREETKRAIKDLDWREIYDQLLPGAYNGDKDQWWNGLYVGLIEK